MQINATDVRKTYGNVTALDGLSLEIPDGSTFGLLGTNGAGKTTLFKLLVGHDRPDSGTLEIGGTDVGSSGYRIRDRIGYLPERVGFPPTLRGREVLAFHADVRGLKDQDRIESTLEHQDRIESTLERVGLSVDAADRPVSGYSNGMRRRLGLATVLLPDPDVLVLDEPTAGLDPRGVAKFHRILERLQTETDATVVFCSHVLSEVERLCDQVAILNRGRVVANGSIPELVDGDTTVHLEASGQVDPVVTAARSIDGTHVTVDNHLVVVTCGGEKLPDLFASLGALPVSVREIDRPGLESQFHELTDESETIPEGRSV